MLTAQLLTAYYDDVSRIVIGHIHEVIGHCFAKTMGGSLGKVGLALSSMSTISCVVSVNEVNPD